MNFSPKMDIWALGIILYRLVSPSSFPFNMDSPFRLVQSIREQEPNPLPAATSPFVKNLIGMLLDKNSETRPSA